MSTTPDGDSVNIGSHINSLVTFEEGLKNSSLLKEFFKMSPSIPAGLDMDCTQIDLDDFSTIICQAMLSTQHIFGLKEHGYMDLESKIDKYKHFYKTQNPVYQCLSDEIGESKEKKVNSEEFYRFKEG